MRPHVGLMFLALMAASACASGGSGSSGPRRDSNRIPAEELEPLDQFNAWDAVRRLRPMWMRPGGIRNSANPAGHYPRVFVDGSPYGDMEILRTLRVETIEEMQFVSASDATIRYGGEFQGGSDPDHHQGKRVTPGWGASHPSGPRTDSPPTRPGTPARSG